MAIMYKVWKYCIFLPALLSFHFSPCQQIVSPTKTDTSVNSTKDIIIHPANNPDKPYIIGEIFITGNRKTRAYIIERELNFKRGDTISLAELVKAFVHGRDHLMNTHLFNDAIISLKGFRGYVADIQIDLKERWYIFPIPYFRPVDRNFTAWAERNYSLSRLDYGLKYTHFNFTGRNDNLRAWLITGYTRQVELAYDQPYAGRSLNHGFGFGVSYEALKEIDVVTLSNKQQFINADTLPFAGKYLLHQLDASLRYYYRPTINTRHFFRLSFHNISLDSTVLLSNKNYLDNNARDVFFPELAYVMTYNDVDYISYPLKGVLIETGILHRGINANMNLTQLYVKSIKSWELVNKTYFGTQNEGILKLPFKQPFLNQQLLGYGDFYLRGLEKYVVDGVGGLLSRNTLSRELFNFSLPFTHLIPAHDRIPFRIFIKTYFDCGYVYNKYGTSNSLTNKFLYTGGFGIDIVSFYDAVFRFEYSFNQLGQSGFFFHVKNDF